MTGECVDLDHLAVFITLIFSETGSEHRRADQRRDTADHVDRAGTCVVMEPELTQPAAAPDPVRFDRVDEQRDNARVDTVSGEFRSFRHRAGYDGRGGGAENEVEYECGSGGKVAVPGRRDELLEVTEQVHVRDTDQSEQGILAHHDRVAQESEHDRADTKVHQVFHDDVAGVLGAGKARLYHGKACLHPEHQRGSDQEPEFYCHSHSFTFQIE